LGAEPPVSVKTDAVYFTERPSQEVEQNNIGPEYGVKIDWKGLKKIHRLGDQEISSLKAPIYPADLRIDVDKTYLRELTPDDLIDEVKKGKPPRVWLSGFAGVGKTRFSTGRLKEACEANGWEFISLAPTTELSKSNPGMETLKGYVSTKNTLTLRRKRASNQVFFIDEVGMCPGSDIAALVELNPLGIVIAGDQYQTAAIDITRLAKHLKLDTIEIGLHANDRYGGCPRMHALIESVVQFIPKHFNHRTQCPIELVHTIMLQGVTIKPMAEAGIFQDKDNTVLGWRRKFVDPAGGTTIQSAQGKTLPENTKLHVIDWIYTNPRLVYTAITRSRRIDDVILYADVPEGDE
jgi:hypothetical protein